MTRRSRSVAVARAPSMIQEFVREIIENFAHERGDNVIEPEFVQESKEQAKEQYEKPNG